MMLIYIVIKWMGHLLPWVDVKVYHPLEGNTLALMTLALWTWIHGNGETNT